MTTEHKPHRDLDEREIAQDMRSQKWADVHDNASELDEDSKQHQDHIAAFREWASAPYGKPKSTWEITREQASELFEQIESDAYYKLWKDENAKVIELVEQLETTREERDLFYDRLKESREQLTALRATVQKELDFMDAFPAVEDGSPIALVIETLRLALASSPASEPDA